MSNTPGIPNEEHAEAFMAEKRRKHDEWLAQPMGRSEWLELLMRCQNGDCTCMFAMEKIEHELDKATPPRTPNASLPPLNPGEPRRKMLVEIEVHAHFEKHLNNQWEIEREIAADRWGWQWADTRPPAPLI